MNNLNISQMNYITMDTSYHFWASKVYRYGYLTVLCFAILGNTCQIITFSRRVLLRISTGVLFLALSLSDSIHILLHIYVPIVFGFHQSDQSNQTFTCRIRHFFSYFTSNSSAWILTTISCDRWIRTQYGFRGQQLCTHRNAIYMIMLISSINVILHIHILTPLFGPFAGETAGVCGPNPRYHSYVEFFNKYWPMVTIFTVTILPGGIMIVVFSAIVIKISRTRRIRLNPGAHYTRRQQFLHRQMFILMSVEIMIFLLTSLPVILLRLILSTLQLHQSVSLRLLLSAIFGLISLLNYGVSFYLHCLTSKLFRREFFRAIHCKRVSHASGSNNLAHHTAMRHICMKPS